MRAQTANPQFKFELPSLSYIDARWEEPSLRAPAESCHPVRETGLAGWLARQMDVVRTWRRNRQATAELGMMSDRELMDIGITRSDMHRVFEPEFDVDSRQRGDFA